MDKEKEKLRSAESFVEESKHLPDFLKDFHNQKDLFKTIYQTYSDGSKEENMPNWIQAHCFTIDWFLWFMGQRGYTLQKSRAKVDFKPLFKN